MKKINSWKKHYMEISDDALKKVYKTINIRAQSLINLGCSTNKKPLKRLKYKLNIIKKELKKRHMEKIIIPIKKYSDNRHYYKIIE